MVAAEQNVQARDETEFDSLFYTMLDLLDFFLPLQGSVSKSCVRPCAPTPVACILADVLHRHQGRI